MAFDLALVLLYYVDDIFYAGFVILSLYRLSAYKSNELLLFLAFLVLGISAFSAYGVPLQNIIVLAIGMMLFNGLVAHAEDKSLSLLHVIASIIFILITYTAGVVFIAQAMLFGMLGSISALREPKFRISTRKIELERDIVHILAGISLILCFAFLAIGLARLVLLSVVICGLLAVRYAEMGEKNGRLAAFLYRFERGGARLGHGALWLALGSLLAVSFLTKAYILAVFCAIFIGDPLATLAGIGIGGPILPYNKKKSVAGTLVYLISTAATGYLFVGYAALWIGIAAALVEGIDFGMDDNFTVSLGLSALIWLSRSL